MASQAVSRGVRNNNPGNIDRNHIKWQGMAPDQSSDKRFIVFKTPAYGIRALAVVLQTYQSTHHLYTIRGIINRWAPPRENDTTSYVQLVAKKCGVTPEGHINVLNDGIMFKLVKAIIEHENGYQPYSDPVILHGLSLAGITKSPELKPLSKSRTIAGSAMVTGGTTIAAVTEQVQQSQQSFIPDITASVVDVQYAASSLSMYLSWAVYVSIALSIIGVGLVLYARFSDRKKGLR